MNSSTPHFIHSTNQAVEGVLKSIGCHRHAARFRFEQIDFAVSATKNACNSFIMATSALSDWFRCFFLFGQCD